MTGFAILFVWISALGASSGLDGDEIPTLKVERSTYSESLDRMGTFVPAEYAEIALWPETYSGELRWEDVASHGTLVRKGDRLGRFDTEAIDRQLETVERDLAESRIALENLRLEQALEQEGEALSLARSHAERDEAVRALEGWEKVELAFARRSADMSQQSFEDNIQDQKDELAQLESMYREDELTDATEEIVLMRSRRSLARSLARFDMSKEQRAYKDSFSTPVQTAQRRRAVQAKEHAHKATVQRAEIARTGRRLKLEAAERGLREKEEQLAKLEHDRALLELTAPRDGVLLHGGVDDYRPGRSAPRHERGGRATFQKPIFTIAKHDRFQVAFDLPESKVAGVKNGQVVHVDAVFDDSSRHGTVRVEQTPSPRSAGGPENLYEARVSIGQPLPGLQAGMRAQVKIETQIATDALLLPRTAIFGAGEDTYCWVATAQGFERVSVKLGRGDERQVVVRDGLKAAQVVLLSEPPQ